MYSTSSGTITARSRARDQGFDKKTRSFSSPSHLSAQERERYRRVPKRTSYVPHPSFASSGAEGTLFGESARRISVPGWVSFSEVPEDQEMRRCGRTALCPQDEAELFLRYNYSRYRLARLARAQQHKLSKTRAGQMLLWHQRAEKARSDLIQVNMALVLAMAKRTRIGNVEFAELVSEGNMALLRSVEKFDVSRGFKFSTYACRAILKSFNRLATKTSRYRQHFPIEYDPELERSDYDVMKHDMQHADSLDSLREILAKNGANLTGIERTILTERFALASRDRKRTLAEVGRMVGLTNERVRQIQNIAMGKLRCALDAQYLAS